MIPAGPPTELGGFFSDDLRGVPSNPGKDGDVSRDGRQLVVPGLPSSPTEIVVVPRDGRTVVVVRRLSNGSR